DGQRDRREDVQVLLDRGHVERPDAVRAERPDDQEEPEEEAGVTDPVHEERLLPRGGVLGLLVPEADQQVRAEPDALPADEEEQQVVGEDEDQHRRREQIQVREEAREAGVAVHVADGVDVDQEADAGHDERHDGRQRVEAERDVGVERSGDDPLVDAVVERRTLRQRVQPERRRDDDAERRGDDARTDDLHGAGRAPPEEDVEQDAERGERDDPAEQRRLDYHLSVASSSAFVVSRFRNIARMIASPTAASAAATVITKKTITCPSREPRLRASATNVRLTAFSISSIAMKMMMTFRRTRTPR